MSNLSEEEIIKDLQKYVELINKEYCDECNELNVISGKYCNGSRNVARAIQGLLDLYQTKTEQLNTALNSLKKEKEKNKKAIEMLQEHIKYCEQEAEGSLNNEICHIALKFDKHLLQELLEGK